MRDLDALLNSLVNIDRNSPHCNSRLGGWSPRKSARTSRLLRRLPPRCPFTRTSRQGTRDACSRAACDPREGLSDFGELLGAVEGATEVIPEASGVVRLFRQAQTRGIGEGLRTICTNPAQRSIHRLFTVPEGLLARPRWEPYKTTGGRKRCTAVVLAEVRGVQAFPFGRAQ
jgi:hypothetical protein